jgi:methylmalonyl-CoA mutase N-terminal domain/subunit
MAEKSASSKSGKEVPPVVLESGIEVKPVYSAEDLEGIDLESELAQPGSYPFTRGIHPLMYRKRPFTMRQYSGFGTAEETNERFKFLISQGQTGLNVAFDLPTQLGLDSDDLLAEGEIGRVGMAVDSLKDMERAFQDIPVDKISTSLTINSVASVMIAMYAVVAEKQGVSLKEIRGTSQNDILKEYIGRGTWIFAVEPSIRLIADTMEFCAKEMPRYYPVSVCGYHIRESGANPVQEIAYAYCIAKEYVDRVKERGVDVNDFVPQISFNFDIHGNFFEQIAKFRAARRLWAKIVKNDYGSTNPKAMMMKMIAGGGGGGLTIEQPENNIIRGAYYALISALSGTQTMALCSYDEAYTIPSKKAALLSLRTMQILVEEMGLKDTVDPLAGSYYIEWLTTELEKRIVEQMDKVSELGGIVKAVSEGTIQREVAHQAFEVERRIQSGDIPKVGVNIYKTDDDEEREIEFHEHDPKIGEAQISALHSLKQERDSDAVESALKTLSEKAEIDGNLMPYIMDAVRVYATVGEIQRF